MKFKIFLGIAATMACGLAAAQRAAPAHAVLTDEHTSRVVVKFQGTPASAARADAAASGRAGYKLSRVKVLSSGAVVYHLGQEVSLATAKAAAARIAQDPAVRSAEPDLRVRAPLPAVTNDWDSAYQWPLMARTAAAGGADFIGAWALTRGAGVLVGVIDSGSYPHPDMPSPTVAGYDFVSADTNGAFDTAGDGDGRDADVTDPGNYCVRTQMPSNWHGLNVASLIGAIADNGDGIAGAAPEATLMQIRAVGRCGGYLSDIADALTWSVGAPVAGVPLNTTPVQVVNLSVGARAGTACPAFMQDAVNAATSRNVPVVVAAGDDGQEAVGAPASCSGVIVVGSHTGSGDMALVSNHSPAVTLTAPGSGGGCASQTTNCHFEGAAALGDHPLGLSLEGYGSKVVPFAGTSAAAPHVTSAVALIRAVAPHLTPDEIKAILVATARVHAADSYCEANRGMCGAGMLDANAAVHAAVNPVLAIAPSYPAHFIAGNTSVTLTATVTAGMGGTYSWTQVSGTPVQMSGTNTAAMTVGLKLEAQHPAHRVG